MHLSHLNLPHLKWKMWKSNWISRFRSRCGHVAHIKAIALSHFRRVLGTHQEHALLAKTFLKLHTSGCQRCEIQGKLDAFMAFLAFFVGQSLLWRNQFLKMWRVHIPVESCWNCWRSCSHSICPSSLPPLASSVMRSALWSKSLPKVGKEYGKGACDQRQCLWQNRWTGSKVPKSKIGGSNRAYDWLYISMCSYLKLFLVACVWMFFSYFDMQNRCHRSIRIFWQIRMCQTIVPEWLNTWPVSKSKHAVSDAYESRLEFLFFMQRNCTIWRQFTS